MNLKFELMIILIIECNLYAINLLVHSDDSQSLKLSKAFNVLCTNLSFLSMFFIIALLICKD